MKKIPKWSGISIGLAVGTGMGLVFGTFMENFVLGITMGIILGLAVGISIEVANRWHSKKTKNNNYHYNVFIALGLLWLAAGIIIEPGLIGIGIMLIILGLIESKNPKINLSEKKRRTIHLIVATLVILAIIGILSNILR